MTKDKDKDTVLADEIIRLNEKLRQQEDFLGLAAIVFDDLIKPSDNSDHELKDTLGTLMVIAIAKRNNINTESEEAIHNFLCEKRLKFLEDGHDIKSLEKLLGIKDND